MWTSKFWTECYLEQLEAAIPSADRDAGENRRDLAERLLLILLAGAIVWPGIVPHLSRFMHWICS